MWKVLSVVAVVFFTLPVQAETSRLFKIGVTSALSGPAATYGEDVRDAILFAKKELGADDIQLIFEDSKCNGKDAVSAAQKFINIDKVNAALGFACSGAALAAAPLYERAGIPMIIVSGSSPKIRDAGEYVYRTTPSDRHAAQLLSDFVKERHSRVAVLSVETEYALDLLAAFREASAEARVTVIEESVLETDTDFRSSLARLKQKNVEAIFLNAQSEQGASNMIKQLVQMKWTVPVYGAYFPGSPAFLSSAGKGAEGMIFADTQSLRNLLSSDGKEVFERFKAQGGVIRSIESVFASGFEGFRVLSEALRSKKPKAFLDSAKIKGIFGEYRFDAYGEIEGMGFVMKEIKEGKSVLYTQ